MNLPAFFLKTPDVSSRWKPTQYLFFPSDLSQQWQLGSGDSWLHSTAWRNILPGVWQAGRSLRCTLPEALCEDGSSDRAISKKDDSEQCYSHRLNPNMNPLQFIPPEGFLQAIAPTDSKQEPGRNLGRINEKWDQNEKCRKQYRHKLILKFYIYLDSQTC